MASGCPAPAWFVGAELNFAENLLRHRDDRPAIIAWTEDGRRRELSYRELYQEVAKLAAALRREGIGPGDRVAAVMPHAAETIVAMLATTALGAIWSSCSPDFGVQGVVDRFGQIEPKVLITIDGYRYNGKPIDVRGKLAEIAAPPARPAARGHGAVPRAGAAPGPLGGAVLYDDFLVPDPGPIPFAQLPFAHPVYILYSSGTTGVPKAIVHGAGGTLLQHLKELLLHTDLKPEDRIFYFTTCGWMMWNWQVSALATGATLVVYDGSPFHPDGNRLFDLAQAEGVTVFGTSAKYLDAVKKAGLEPARTHDLSALRAILSTGSPLVPESFDFVYRSIKTDLHLASISGGTDIMGCFALGNPIAPVWRGELQTRGLGMAVEVWNEQGEAVVGEPGELVCVKPFPSMPVGFWNDPDGSRYRAGVFRAFPRRMDARRPRRADRARRPDHLRPLRCRAQPRRRAHRHRRDLSSGGADSRGGRSARGRPGVGRRSARGAVRAPGRGGDLRRGAGGPDPASDPHQLHAAPRARQDPEGRRHPAHHEQQDRRAGGARDDSRAPGQECRCPGQPRSPWSCTAISTSSRPESLPRGRRRRRCRRGAC